MVLDNLAPPGIKNSANAKYKGEEIIAGSDLGLYYKWRRRRPEKHLPTLRQAQGDNAGKHVMLSPSKHDLVEYFDSAQYKLQCNPGYSGFKGQIQYV